MRSGQQKDTLPADKVASAMAFIERIKEIPYFMPDGKPTRYWNMVLASTWKGAFEKAIAEKEYWDNPGERADPKYRGPLAPMYKPVDYTHGNPFAHINESAHREEINRIGMLAYAEVEKRIVGLDMGFEPITAISDAYTFTVLNLTAHMDFKGMGSDDRQRHLDHARASMEVWEKGYGRIDRNSVNHFVYCSSGIILRR
jgi:hypothetical protein